MSEIIDGQLYIGETRVFVALDRGNLWCMVRATDLATFDALALQVGLLVYTTPAQDAVLDPETQEVITPAVAASGPLKPAPNITITRIGALTTTPGVYDAEGVEVTPPVVDARYHANFWLASSLVAAGGWEQWALAWSASGQPTTPNKAEEGIAYQGIELIDPMTVASASNVLL